MTRRVFILALATPTLITLFVVSWLYQTYEGSKTIFIQTASNDLQKSINAYRLQENAHQLYNGSSDSTIAIYVDPSGKKPGDLKRWQRYQAGLSPANLQMMQTLISGLLTQVMNTPMATQRIRAIYHRQLLEDGIPLEFGFTVFPDDHDTHAGDIKAPLGLTANSPVLTARFEGVKYFLLKRNILPFLGAFLLLLITFGCVWYLHSVIAAQTRLDAAKDDLINNMAHEFRTPVTILRSTHEALTAHGALENPEKSLRYLRANRAVLQKMENDLDRILTLAPFDRHHPSLREEETDLEDLMQEVLSPYRLSGDLQFYTENSLKYRVRTDAQWMTSILFNLVDNAVKYGGKNITILFRRANDDTSWMLEIRDDGRGIDERYLPYIFDRFYRVPQGDRHDTKGFGIGLSYVKTLTAHLGGTISVNSKPGRGTTFLLSFPWKN